MDFLDFFIIAVVSSLSLFVWQLLTRVYPAYRSAKIHESLAALTESFTRLNQDGLANAKITSGDYLHDKFCKLVFLVLTRKINLKFSALRHITSNAETEKGRMKFHSEIQALDEETREIVGRAILATAKIFWLRNPIVFTLALIKQVRQDRNFSGYNEKRYIPKQAMKSAEAIAFCSGDDDYSFVPI